MWYNTIKFVDIWFILMFVCHDIVMFQLESKNRPLALQQVEYWHTNIRVCLEDTNCLIVDRIVDGKGRVQQHYCPEGIQPTNYLS